MMSTEQVNGHPLDRHRSRKVILADLDLPEETEPFIMQHVESDEDPSERLEYWKSTAHLYPGFHNFRVAVETLSTTYTEEPS